MRVLVTGAAGFIGSNLVETLLARGDRVVGLDAFDGYYLPALKRANAARLAALGAQVLTGDVRDAAAVDRALERARPEAIVHLAARAGVRSSFAEPQLYRDVNVGGTERLLEAAARRGIGRFVFASSSSVYGDAPVPFREALEPRPISPYAETKAAGEARVRDFHARTGAASLCLRLFAVYGPRQRPDLALRTFVEAIEAGRPVRLFGDGGSRRDYTWVGDVCDAILAALGARCGFEILNVGSGRAVRLARLVELVESAVGKRAVVERSERARGDVETTLADLTGAARVLGYRPRVGIEEGVGRFVEWYRAEGRSSLSAP